MAVSAAIVIKGVSDGLERWSKILMPALLVMLVGLLIYSFFLDGFSKAMAFMFSGHAEQLKPIALVEAVGQAFFSLSLGQSGLI